ncbi:MAG: hypothetical protein IJW48_04825 [Clostridia bacterium]|nr:hypothetical protein [Clostridia bacterium]
MGNIIYAKSDSSLDPVIGKYEHPIKMVISSESDLYRKNHAIVPKLFNVEKSTRYSETAIGESNFDVFKVTEEGQGAENDSIGNTYRKTIYHSQFMKEFTITAEMMEDAKYGIATEAKRRAAAFARAYEKTRNKLAAKALYSGTAATMNFANGTFDITSPDNKPLFHGAHTFSTDKMAGKTQSNLFHSAIADTAALENTLNRAANAMRNFWDEDGEVLGYVPDLIVIPGNRAGLEAMVKKVCGSEREAGSNKNDINIQYGNWGIVVLTDWVAADDRFILMSSEANKNLNGSVFYDRVPLTVSNWVDRHTGNYIWTGRARMGVGHYSWKHTSMVIAADKATDGSTALM